MDDMLADRFYEAAFVPELWPETLATLAAAMGARESGLMLYGTDGSIRWTATEHCAKHIRGYLERFPDEDLYCRNLRTERFDLLGQRGFSRDSDLLTPAERATDQFQAELRSDGLEWQALTRIALPGGDNASFSIERMKGSENFSTGDLDRLNALWPHLARSGMTAARLGLERARGATETMQAIGLAAAVLSPRGIVRASNALFDALGRVLRPAAHGRVRLADANAQRLYDEAVADFRREPAVRSIPVVAQDEGGAVVLHLMPLRRAAQDVFSGGEVMLAATPIGVEPATPEPAVLKALFDLTGAEARIATTLATGGTVADAARAAGITQKSARTYLDRIFRKTGTGRQSQLVSLLRSAQPFPPRQETS